MMQTGFHSVSGLTVSMIRGVFFQISKCLSAKTIFGKIDLIGSKLRTSNPNPVRKNRYCSGGQHHPTDVKMSFLIGLPFNHKLETQSSRNSV